MSVMVSRARSLREHVDREIDYVMGARYSVSLDAMVPTWGRTVDCAECGVPWTVGPTPNDRAAWLCCYCDGSLPPCDAWYEKIRAHLKEDGEPQAIIIEDPGGPIKDGITLVFERGPRPKGDSE